MMLYLIINIRAIMLRLENTIILLLCNKYSAYWRYTYLFSFVLKSLNANWILCR